MLITTSLNNTSIPPAETGNSSAHDFDNSFQLIAGDCLEELVKLPTGSFDALVTDPPYNSGGRTAYERSGRLPSQKYVVGGTKKVRCDFEGENRDQRGYAYWCALWLTECYRLLKVGSPVLLFTDWRQMPLTTDILQAGGFVWRGVVAWDKGGACRPMLGRFAHQAEYVVWGSKGPMGNQREGVHTLPGVYQHGVKQSDKHHMTGKPTPLMEDLLKIVTPGGLVLDPFAGSGTTGVACIRTGRRFVGIEKQPEYAEISLQRLTEARDACL